MIKHVNRRAILQGLGGAALALPFLEYFQPRRALAQAAGENTRLIICYTGQAMGGDRDDKVIFVPGQEGSLLTQPLPLSLEPLGGGDLWTGRYNNSRTGDTVEPIRNWEGPIPDVRDKVSVVTGMRIEQGTGSGAKAPKYDHRGTVSAQLSGTTSQQADAAKFYGPSADVLFEEHFKSAPTMRCLAQADNYGNGGQYDRYLSFQRNGSGGTDPIAAQVSPKAMYNAMFEGFVAPDTTADAAQLQNAQRRKSVLDLVLPSANRLQGRLGMEDRARLQAHLDGLQTLRNRLDGIEGEAAASCALPAHPGDDPQVTGGKGGSNGNFNEGEGWSGEEKRAVAFIDMMVMAMACDMTRSATLMFSYHQSFLNAQPPTGLKGDQHQVGHGNTDIANGSRGSAVALCHHYPVRYFGYLVDRLASVQTGPDRTLLDECAAGLFFEAGHGSRDGSLTAHHGANMCSLIAGGAGGLKMGEHIKLQGEHPASVLSTMLHAVGCPSALGDIDKVQDRLFV